MSAHDGHFLGRELTGLEKNSVRNSRFSNVMQECSARDHTDFAGSHPDAARHGNGVCGHALGVSYRVALLTVEDIA